ncbi:hypothetical protein TrST_g6879 [Triparma strigata]|uniref:Uncharacterized protein n=1 Tax=Triparma strigata TaxID=1606541 RepID=A0A9W7EQE9_9STRA|nr:hypothetical protein TrST_g6879 [Triparma strigata]
MIRSISSLSAHSAVTSGLGSSSQCPVTITNRWLRNFVLPLNLCPFASRPLLHKPDELTIINFTETDPSKLTDLVLAESSKLSSLDSHPKKKRGTTIIILSFPIPTITDTFTSYMSYISSSVETLPPFTSSSIQVAAFHPSFTFSDADVNDFTNYVNRSPYPMLHLLREEEVGRAVEEWEEKGKGNIWENNYDVLRSFSSVSSLEDVALTGHVPPLIKEILKKRSS